MSAWVGVLALAGFALSPEQAAPAAELATRPATALLTGTVSMTLDEPHDTRLSGPATTPILEPSVGARWGTDIGWPQCGHALPDIEVDFTIIQVTSGRPGTVNPCLREQVGWAASVRSVVNAYVVPGSPSAADLAAADRRGSCRGKRSCLLRAAGAADAAHALAGAEASGLDARGWWLDIEDVAARTLWGADTDANTQVVIGWRDGCVAPARGSGCTPPAATGARWWGTGRPTFRSGPRSAWPVSAPPNVPAAGRSPAGQCCSPSG